MGNTNSSTVLSGMISLLEGRGISAAGMDISGIMRLAVPLLGPDIRFGLGNIVVSHSVVLDDEGSLLGIHSISGHDFVGCAAYDDHELPVFFIVYISDNGPAVYVPLAGNNVCTVHMCAFGSCNCRFDADMSIDWALIREDIMCLFGECTFGGCVSSDQHSGQCDISNTYSSMSTSKLISTARKLHKLLYAAVSGNDQGMSPTEVSHGILSICDVLGKRGYKPIKSIDFVKMKGR